MKFQFSSVFFSSLWRIALTAFATLAVGVSTATAGTETILYAFQTTLNGKDPAGGLVADAAGNLYGTTQYGGAYDYGTVFELTPNSQGGWTNTVIYNFKGTTGGAKDGWDPMGTLTLDAAGNLYGATTWGGNSSLGVGTIFKLSKSNGNWVESVIWSFQQYSSTDGFNPQGGLVFDKAGNLYGTTRFGGGYSQNGCSFDGGCGTVFWLSPKANGKWQEAKLYVFQGMADGSLPMDALAIDAAGNLYGTTWSIETSGTVFKLTPAATLPWPETTIYTFTGVPDGYAPGGGMIFDSAGNLYGTTAGGGTSTGCYEGEPCGTVFELEAGSDGQWTHNILYNFNGSDGWEPQGKLLFDQAGNLYGTTSIGGTLGDGVVFKLTPGSGGAWSDTVLWNFTGGSDGLNPAFGVIARAGKLYGANTPAYYSTENGTVFELTPASGSWNETTLSSFADVDGGTPQASVIADSAGNLYGTTSQGGTAGFGTVFELIHSGSGWQEKTLYNFTSGGGTYSVHSALIFDDAGNLFGETVNGGASNLGTVYELSPAAGGNWAEKVLFTFTGSKTGVEPGGGLIFDANGNLYGTTRYGGNNHPAGCGSGCGTVFELTPENGHWKETVLYNFAGGSDGVLPLTNLIFDQAGNLYGTTADGGVAGPICGNGCGTVFKLTPSGGGWTESIIFQFTDAQHSGASPAPGLVFDQAGNLYGTTAYGGNHGSICAYNGCGVVFELSPQPGAWKETILYTFLGSDATFPNGNLIFDQAGNLYGTTQGGLFGDWGSVFELSPLSGGGWSENALYTFPYPGGGDGFFPAGGLILGPSGTLYGTTADGGDGNYGTVFQITP